jgi:hypothetical protein
MAMPRIAGKAEKIAQQVIPGMNRNRDAKPMSKRKVEKLPNDRTELKIVDINEHLGKLK